MLKRLTKLMIVSAMLLLSLVSGSRSLNAAPAYQADQTIVEIAVADGRFTTLVAALGAAELVDTLNGEGPFTVFAPTDDAFAALPEGTVEALLNDIPALTDILLYHVVSGKVMAADVVNLSSANTLLDKPVQITVKDGTVFINEAQVIITDIEASNGVIHVIDAVLIPPPPKVDKPMVNKHYHPHNPGYHHRPQYRPQHHPHYRPQHRPHYRPQHRPHYRPHRHYPHRHHRQW